ncbi:RagB/SusD family nutrient uptake outer membrane protein [Chitinophaga sp. 30R24]|uniref:RagB/SusD family nutrient uptake outer membrane protein n=1 Tax=Chitinophaga sp. 30R24 TaxID=3248838 RepID=UPI003B8F984F
MKKIYPLIYIALFASLISCRKSFLEIVPLGNLIATTTNDYDQLMNDVRFYLPGYGTYGGWQEPVLMGDEAAALSVYFDQGYPPPVLTGRLFRWEDIIYQQGDPVQFSPQFLTLSMGDLYALNKIINEVMGSSGGTTAQKSSIRGEALATRAFINFELINYYAKPYVSATAATDPGFPIIDKADVNAVKFDRGSVQGMYDFIIRDITEAIKVLPIRQVSPTRMSKAAAEGLLAKVYLFMGRYNDALPLLNAAFSDLAPGGIRLYDYNLEFAPGGSFLPIDPVNGPNSPGNNRNDMTEAIVSKVFYNASFNPSYPTKGLVLAPQVAALYDAQDLRLKLYTSTGTDGVAQPEGLLRKYVTYSRFGLQLPELYLLSAECKARLNDLGGAKTDIETLRRHRMPVEAAVVPPAIAGDQTALVKFVIDERTREFAMEGYRWFDMRRLSVDPIFAGLTFTHIFYNADGSTTVYTLDQSKRLVLQLPLTFIQANPGMQNNP